MRTFAYNDRGDIVEEIIEQNTGLMLEDIGSQAWTERLAYRYDDYGNWIEKTTETILHTGEARLSMIERRELTYY